MFSGCNLFYIRHLITRTEDELATIVAEIKMHMWTKQIFEDIGIGLTRFSKEKQPFMGFFFFHTPIEKLE